MSRDKQIEEMAKYCETVFPTKGMVGGLPIKIKHDYKAYAELFHNAGYRKASEVAREMVEMLTNFFSNDEITRHCEIDAEYINEQIVRIANELMEGKRC